jgi:hypothetical protein
MTGFDLNGALYSEIESLPPREVDALWDELATIVRAKYKATERDVNAWKYHRFCLALTVGEFDQLEESNREIKQVVEMGGANPFSDVIRARWPHLNWEKTRSDLRYT